jgi:hypothetical protein
VSAGRSGVLCFGYEQQLHRRLNLFSTLAAGFSYYAVRHKHLPSPLLAPGRDDVTDDERARAAGV